MAKRQLISYNALRGICAMGILFSHMSYLVAAVNPFWDFTYNHFMRFGSRCTSFFFIVSGFLLAYTWKDKRFGSYIRGKLKRLYPLTFIVFILAVGVSLVLNDTVNNDMPLGSPMWFLCIALNLVPLKAFVPIESVFYSFHGPSWYISVLLMFYVVGYLIVRELKRNPIKVSKMIIGVIILTYIAELVLCISVDKAADGSLLSDARLYLTYVNPYFRILAEGLLGVMLCEYMPALQSKIRKWNRSFLEFAAVGIFLSFFVLCNFITSSILNAWIWFVPVSFLLIAFYEDDGMVSKAAEGRVWQFLGNISFEIYMTHAFVYEGLPVIAGILSIAFKDWLIYHAGTRFIITLVLCIIFAWVVHLLMNCKDRQRFVSSFKR